MRVVGTKVAWEGSFIRTVLIAYESNAGSRRTWEAVERVNCNGIVVVVPLTAGGECLLVRQFRPALDQFVIEFPAGLNDRGETLTEAAVRELVEETGFYSDTVEFLAEGPISSGMSTEILSVFLAKKAVPASPELRRRYPAEETEAIEVILTPLPRVYETIESHRDRGDYVDLKIFGLIELARKRL